MWRLKSSAEMPKSQIRFNNKCLVVATSKGLRVKGSTLKHNRLY